MPPGIAAGSRYPTALMQMVKMKDCLTQQAGIADVCQSPHLHC
ncbi:hypothetical protein [Scytonema sp. PCC 10023]